MMCEICNQDMSDPKTKTCIGRSKVIFPNGESLDAIAYYPRDLSTQQLKELAEMHPEYLEGFVIDARVLSFTVGDRCSDCNVAMGGLHHVSCCNERCPRCKGQLVSCGCLTDRGKLLEKYACVYVIKEHLGFYTQPTVTKVQKGEELNDVRCRVLTEKWLWDRDTVKSMFEKKKIKCFYVAPQTLKVLKVLDGLAQYMSRLEACKGQVLMCEALRVKE